MVATIIVVWMGIPFVAFTVYAGLTQIPGEIVEAARLDGANFRDIFRYVSFPALKPILLILTSLSVIWDFRVFTQIYVLQRGGRDHPRHQPARRLRLPDLDRREPLRHRGRGRRRDGRRSRSLLTVVYLRADVADRRSCERRSAPVPRGARKRVAHQRSPALGVAVDRPVPRVLDGADVVQAQQRGQDADPVVRADATRRSNNYRKVFERDYFWTAMRNSALVTVTVVFLALVHRLPRRGGPVAVPLPRAQVVPRRGHRHPDDPRRGADHLAVPGARRARPDEPHHRAVADLPDLRPAVHDLDAARVRRPACRSSWRRRPGRRRQPLRGVHAGDAAARRARASWRPASSPSSWPGTSSSSRS